jgi:hypothetical protein
MDKYSSTIGASGPTNGPTGRELDLLRHYTDPASPMAGYRASLRKALIENLIQLRENTNVQANGHKFGEELSESKQALAKLHRLNEFQFKESNPYEKLSATERLLLRSLTEKLITKVKLERLKREQQSQSE